ncbi:MAG: DUF721 domain-containing protein [Myxococcota bacterium]
MGEAVAFALDRSGLTDQARRVRIARAWRQAVGPTLANRTHPDGFRRGVLIVKTASAAWQNELTYLRGELIEKINQTLGQEIVKDIKVVAGSWARRGTPEGAERRALTNDERSAVDDAAQAIRDPELRAAFEDAMGAVARGSKASK